MKHNPAIPTEIAVDNAFGGSDKYTKSKYMVYKNVFLTLK